MNEDCPNTNDRKHRFTYSVGSGTKADFEPTEFGKNADDTLYRRVLYSQLACQCGKVRMARVSYEENA